MDSVTDGRIERAGIVRREKSLYRWVNGRKERGLVGWIAG